MTANEPLLLYTGQQQSFSLFSWRESDSESFFMAVPGGKATLELNRAVRSLSGEQKIKIIDEHLKNNGGMLISANRNENGGYRLVRRTQDSIRAKARGYIPPKHCQVFAPGGTVESQRLTGKGFDLNAFQYALIPVDEKAEIQLQSTVRELDKLPGDLRAEMFQTLTGHAASQSIVHDLKENPAPAKSSLALLWVLLALIIGLACGCAGYAVYAKQYSASGRAQAEKARRHAIIDPALGDFDSAMKQSTSPVFKTLYEFHVLPLLITPVHGVTTSSLESWMLFKVALFRLNPPKDWNSGVLPSTVNWSESSNQEAKADFAKKESLNVPDRNAVSAATCLEGGPSAAFVTPDDCSKVDWSGAATDLKALTEYVKKASGSPLLPASSGPAPVQPQTAAH